jgi:hypothetical protein
MKQLLVALFLVSTTLITACATSVDAFYSAHADEKTVKTIYLVAKSAATAEMDERIRKDLNHRGLNVVVGPDTNKVTTEDAIMKYTETWTTDFPTSLTALDVILFDKNGELIASSHWKNAKFSALQPMSKTVADAIEIIFEKVHIQQSPAN